MNKSFQLAILFTLSGWSADAGEIRLRERVECEGSVVRLGDVAEVYAGDIVTIQRLSAIELFPAPARGRSRIVRRQEVQQLLGLSDVQLHDYRFSGAEVVAVRAKAPVAKVLAAQTPASGQPVMEKPTLVERAAELRELEAKSSHVQLAVYAVRPLKAGATIQTSDVQLLSAGDSGDAVASSLEQVVGHEVTRAVAQGQPVPLEMVQTARLVHRGEDVTIQSLAAGVTITTGGKALESGGRGDVIQVEIPGGREKLFAHVSDFRTVTVYAQTPKFAGAQAVEPPK